MRFVVRTRLAPSVATPQMDAHPKSGPLVETDDTTHIAGAYEKVYYLHSKAFWVSRGGS